MFWVSPPRSTMKNRCITHSLLLSTVIFWGLAFVFIKLSLRELSPANLTLLRFYLAGPLFIITALVGWRTFIQLRPVDWVLCLIVGVCGSGIYHFFLNYGAQFTTSSTASLIIALNPILLVVFSIIFLKEPFTWLKGLGVLTAFLGVIIIILLGQPQVDLKFGYFLAIAAIFISTLTSVVYSLLGKYLLRRFNAIILTSLAMSLGSLTLAPFINRGFISQVSTLSVNGWIAVSFLAILSTYLSYITWYWGLKRTDASRAIVYYYLIPIFALIGGRILLDETITLFLILGGILTISGVIMANLKGQSNGS